jgi:hypothetical protein
MTSHVPVVALDDAAADANASTVREALAELDRLVKPPLGVSPHFKSCWAQVTTVRSSLSDRRPLRNIDRDHFFRELNRICADLKRIQDEYWLERNTTSERAHSYVLSDIQSARFAADGARDTDGLREAYAKLQEIREQLTSAMLAVTVGEHSMKHAKHFVIGGRSSRMSPTANSADRSLTLVPTPAVTRRERCFRASRNSIAR